MGLRLAAGMVVLAAIAVACSPDDGAGQGRCPPEDMAALTRRAIALPGWPAPPAPGLEGPLVTASAVSDRYLVDPDPSTRGEHAAFAIAVDPETCEVALEPLAALPLPRTPIGVARERPIGDDALDARRAALVVSGSDGAAGPDVERWDALLAALDVHGRALRSPARAEVEAAIAASCGAVAPGGLVMLVYLGRGTPGGGGGLVLSSSEAGPGATTEVIGYRDTLAVLDERCAHAGAVVWIVDASHFTAEVPARPPDAPPLVLVRTSDPLSADAARASRAGPGLLGEVLAGRIAERRAALCATGARLDESEIIAFFARDPPDDDLRSALVRARWEVFGVPAVARLESEGTLDPGRSEALRATLSGAIPRAPIEVFGELPDGARCEDDAGCGRCPEEACRRPACVDGLCRLVDDDGGGCDDDDVCTHSDVCARGRCRGEAVACDDDNPCTEEACEPVRGCVTTVLADTACDDGDPCTEADACDEIGACRGIERACDDGDPCTTDRCDRDGGGCLFQPANLPCDDGDACTLADRCSGQVCSGTRKTCGDDNACTRDRCDPATGACRFDPLADLAGCDDGDPCTTLDRCRDGQCAGLAATCDDAVACTFDRCEDGQCRHLPAPGTCLSPSGRSCVAVGESPPEAPCLVCAATDRLEPYREGEACADDGLACTLDVCEAGRCVHRDLPESCHDPAGRCVGAGDLLTPCLVCQGGGIVTPVARDTACSGAVGCAEDDDGRCDGLGTCRCQ